MLLVLVALHKVGIGIQDLKHWLNVMQPPNMTVPDLVRQRLVLVTVQEKKAVLINLRFSPSVYRKLSSDSWTIRTPSSQAGFF